MRKLLKQLLDELGFEQSQKHEEIQFYQSRKPDFREFYLCDQIEWEAIDDYLEDRFVKAIKPFFETLHKEAADIYKNTSLLLLVRCDTQLPSSQGDRRKTMRIEEHPFDVKKYVICYTDDSIPKVGEGERASKIIQDIIYDEARFDSFSERAVVDPIYNTAMQLQTKIPVFTLREAEEGIPDLKAAINQAIKSTYSDSEGAAGWDYLTYLLRQLDVFSKRNKIRKMILEEAPSNELNDLLQFIDSLNLEES